MPTQTETYPEARVFVSPFVIGTEHTRILADDVVTAEIADAVASEGGAVFHDVIAPDLLAALLAVAGRAPFTRAEALGHGVRNTDLSDASALPFCLAIARPPFMAWLERVFDCEPIAHIEGLLAQMALGHIVPWHRDVGHDLRRLAMVLNLTTEPYEGGRFELRRKSTRAPMLAYEAHHTGSLAVFRLSHDLQHQVTPLTSGGPRVTFSGWARAPWVEADRVRDLSLATWPPLVPPA